MASIPADTVVVPLANEADATATCTSLRTHLEGACHVTLVYVVEKAGGAPDKASVEQRESQAEDVFRVARAHLESDEFEVESRVLYGTDIVDAIFEAAAAVDADLIAFSPREGSRVTRFLTGDTALALVTNAERPVLVLPASDPGSADGGDL